MDIVIHTITFSSDADIKRMEDVAAATGGRHFHAPTFEDLKKIFKEIASTLPVLTNRLIVTESAECNRMQVMNTSSQLNDDFTAIATRSHAARPSVEFAITAPIFFLFLLAAFEFGWMNVMRHTADNAAYEAARAAMVPGPRRRKPRPRPTAF